MNKPKIFIVSVVVLCALHVALILFSWIAAAVWPELGWQSLLSGAAMRWMLSRYAGTMSSDLLVYILLSAFCIGMFVKSELPEKIMNFRQCNYNEQLGIKVLITEVIIGILICLILAVYPHSPLLSVSGTLFPGPYLRSVFVILMSVFIVGVVSYLLVSGNLRNYSHTEKILTYGLQKSAPIIILYFLVKELFALVAYVF